MINNAFYRINEYGIMIGYDEEAITRVRFSDEFHGKTSPLSDLAASQLKEYIQGKRKVFDLPLKISGTPFQEKVWRELINIPFGETRTYKDIAIAIGTPKASRAVGMANNRNKIAIIIPCHRVIGANGSLTGYAGGLDIKEKLLLLEKNEFLM